MPLSKYQIRNEYSFADPQLYKVADKDDPEALLEGVAMAGLIGLLRQLGDLAEFAAEVFHDLHEEVVTTAARGHSLIVRVQQLEAELPSVERTLLTQTSHTSFLYNSGVDWHPNLRMDKNLVTQGDLPRLVMDSYEECRGPPRLFLLDKFDVAGAGACLKRYTDPSFFKTESISNGRKSEGQREKKTRRLKKRAPRWRYGDTTPESFPSSHAKLHQLFLEERLESGGNDTERHVKLKRRQFTGSFLDQDNKKSYMEKYVYTSPPEQKIATSTDGCELGLEIVEIGTVSPVKESIKNDEPLCSSLDMKELEMKPSMDDVSERKLNEITDSGAVEVPGLNYKSDACKIVKLVNDEECTDVESNSELSVDDSFASEIDNYMDALAAIESEVDTDSECKKPSSYLNAKPIVADFYRREGHREPQSLFSDSQSVGNSTISEDGSNFFKERENSSSSISVNSLAESATDLDAAVVVVPSVPASKSDPDDMSFDHHFMSKGIPGNETEERAMASNLAIEADDIPRSTPYVEETANVSRPTDRNAIVLPRDMEASLGENSLRRPEVDEENSNFADLGIVASQSTPERTDSGHWSSGKHPLHDEAGRNSVVHPENSDDLPSTPDDSVNFPLIESRKSDIGPLISDDKHPETNNALDSGPIDQYSGPECTQSLNTQEQFPEVTTPHHAPLFDSQVGAHPSSQGDHSIKEIFTYLEAGEKASSSSFVGLTETLPPISGVAQACAPETADFGCLEHDTSATVSFRDETNSNVISGSPVRSATYLDDNGTQAIQIDVTSEHECYDKNGYKSEDFSHDAFQSDMPSELVITSNFASATENNSSLDHDVANMEHKETNCCKQIDAENDHQENVVHVASSENLNAEKLKGQAVSLTEECHHNEVVSGQNADLAMQKAADASQNAPVNSEANMLSNGCSPLILLDGSLAGDVHSGIKFIDVEEAPFISASGAQDVESTSMPYQIHQVKGKEFYVDSLSHDNPKPMIPVQDGDSKVNPLQAKKVSSQSTNYPQLTVPKPPPKSAECTIESSAQLVYSTNGLSGTSQAIQKVTIPGQLVSPSFPILDMLPAEPPMSIEPPPLPPLPPMQWRLGRSQNSLNKTAIVPRSPKTQGHQGYSNGNASQQAVLTLPVPLAVSHVSSQNNIIGIGGAEDNHSSASAQTSMSYQNGNQSLEESCQPSVNPPESGSLVEVRASGDCPLVVEENLNSEIESENGQPEHSPEVRENELVNSHDELPRSSKVQNDWHPQPGLVASETESTLPNTQNGDSTNANGNTNETLQKKPARPRNPLIDEVVAIDKSKLRKVERVQPPVESKEEERESLLEQLQLRKVGGRANKPQDESKTEEIGSQLQLRKVGERVKPETELQLEETESPRVQLRKVVGRTHSLVGPKTENRDSLLEQIRNKSFNLKPAVMGRPNVQGPRTNLKLAAILQKASNIRQAMAGSDEEDDADNWSESDC